MVVASAPLSPEQNVVNLAQLRTRLVGFLDHYCDRPLVPESFVRQAPGRTGEQRFAALLEATGFGVDPDKLLEQLAWAIQTRSSDQPGPLVIGGVELPYNLLVYLAEAILGDTGYKTFRETIVDAFNAPFIKLRDAGRYLRNSLLHALFSLLYTPRSMLRASNR